MMSKATGSQDAKANEGGKSELTQEQAAAAVVSDNVDDKDEMEIDQKLKDQITDLEKEQKEKLQKTKLQEPAKPQFSALQNL